MSTKRALVREAHCEGLVPPTAALTTTISVESPAAERSARSVTAAEYDATSRARSSGSGSVAICTEPRVTLPVAVTRAVNRGSAPASVYSFHIVISAEMPDVLTVGWLSAPAMLLWPVSRRASMRPASGSSNGS